MTEQANKLSLAEEEEIGTNPKEIQIVIYLFTHLFHFFFLWRGSS